MLERGDIQRVGFEGFRERERGFSLKYRAIRPSKFFGARRKAALRKEAYAWTPVLGSFVKLREVGDLSYLGFTLCLSVIKCFDWYEALNNHLIGPKTWDRIIEIFGSHGAALNSFMGCLGCQL